MVSAVGLQHRHVPLIPPKAQKPAEGQEQLGKSMESVGHRAKTQVLADGDTAANAQGKAAAMIAKLDLSAIHPQPNEGGGETTAE